MYLLSIEYSCKKVTISYYDKQCYSFFSSLSYQDLQVYYQKSSILLIQANVISLLLLL